MPEENKIHAGKDYVAFCTCIWHKEIIQVKSKIKVNNWNYRTNEECSKVWIELQSAYSYPLCYTNVFFYNIRTIATLAILEWPWRQLDISTKIHLHTSVNCADMCSLSTYSVSVKLGINVLPHFNAMSLTIAWSLVMCTYSVCSPKFKLNFLKSKTWFNRGSYYHWDQVLS